MAQDFLQPFLDSFVKNLPQLLWAIFIFLVGFLIARRANNIVVRFLNKIRLNQVFARLNFEESLLRTKTRFNVVQFFGNIVRYFFVILFLMVSVDIIGFFQLSQLLSEIISYFSNIFVACLIFIIAIFLADFSQKIMIAVLEEEKITYSRFLGRIIRWIIWSLATLAILYQLQIAPTLILTIFIGFIGLIVITVGIAFGLGGKDIAEKALKEFEEKIR